MLRYFPKDKKKLWGVHGFDRHIDSMFSEATKSKVKLMEVGLEKGGQA